MKEILYITYIKFAHFYFSRFIRDTNCLLKMKFIIFLQNILR
jgi:hypothetical protein